MEDEVIYYCEDHDDVDYSSLVECFGNPEDVAKDFLAELGECTLTKANDIKQRLIHAALLIVIIATIIVAAIRVYTDYKQQQALDVEYIEAITFEGDISSYITGPTYSAEYAYSEEEIN